MDLVVDYLRVPAIVIDLVELIVIDIEVLINYFFGDYGIYFLNFLSINGDFIF